ncbi:MAG: hypothetical protein D3910_07560, partial [Candidatus Electrothrix sp. ATG2]|nr:hypothetical protein [Candidatus Electrothrix sp. ATG2]
KKKFPEKPVFFSRTTPTGLVRQKTDGEKIAVQADELADQRCFAFCGIARPEGFQQTLDTLNIQTVAFRSLPDHFSYANKTVRQLIAEAEQAGATSFLCTEKDLVKLRNIELQFPLYGVVMEAQPDKTINHQILQDKSIQRA